MLLLTVLVAAFAGTSALGMYEYVTADNIEFFDGAVEARASSSCAQLDAQLRALPPLPPSTTDQAKAQRLDREVALTRQLVAEMRALGPKTLQNDHPADGWIRDWESLADARSAYADQLRLGVTGAAMHEPQTPDGYPISRRMKDAAPTECAPVVDRLRGAV